MVATGTAAGGLPQHSHHDRRCTITRSYEAM